MTKDEIQCARQAYVSGVREGRDNRASGLGLGLPIVISSIESVGGTFQIDSRAGEGTRCSIEMAFTREDPLLEGISQEKEKETREREKPKKSCKTIAIIDDVEMIRLGAADVLENQGHRVLLESDGVRGLEMLKQKADELDLALVDIQMPNMSGDELIVLYRQWELAERPGRRRLRIYACTGNATSTDSAAYMRAGFDGCISKPVYPQTFKALLSSSKLIVQSALVVGCQHSHFSSGSSNYSSSDSTPPSPGPPTR
jgi:CheY-like chemotaxis protein